MSKLLSPGYYDENDLRGEGFKSLGRDVRVAKNCTIVGVGNVSFDDYVRIDGYCTITATGDGEVTFGAFSHLGSYGYLTGSEGIEIGDFCGLSQGVRIYSHADDYSGEHLVNPCVPEKYKGLTGGKVVLGRHVVLGSGTIILPGVRLGEGVAVGAMSFVKEDLESWGIYAGCPAKRIGDRSRRLLEQERRLLEDLSA